MTQVVGSLSGAVFLSTRGLRISAGNDFPTDAGTPACGAGAEPEVRREEPCFLVPALPFL